MNNSTIQQIEKNRTLAAAYINAVGQKQPELIAELLDDKVEFKGVIMAFNKSSDLIKAFKQLGTILLRNEIKKIFADENEACVIYDLVLADDLDAVPCMEWIKIKNGKIISIQLVFDSKLFLKVREEVLSFRSSQK